MTHYTLTAARDLVPGSRFVLGCTIVTVATGTLAEALAAAVDGADQDAAETVRPGALS